MDRTWIVNRNPSLLKNREREVRRGAYADGSHSKIMWMQGERGYEASEKAFRDDQVLTDFKGGIGWGERYIGRE